MMVRFAWLPMFALLTAAPATYAADSPSADAQAISKIENEWVAAIKTGNKAFFEKYLSGDFTFIGADGKLSAGRAAFIDGLAKVVDASISDERVVVHGTTAVATGRFTVKDSTGVFTTLYTNVFVKGPIGWRAVALQETKAK